MKTFLAVLGALALIVIILFVALFFVGYQRATPLIEEAETYADETIQAVATNWNGAELSARASPEMTALLSDGALQQIMDAGKFQFGPMTTYDGATCTLTHYQLHSSTGETVVAQCTANAEFEKASGSFLVNLVKRSDEWKVLGFFVSLVETKEVTVQVDYRPHAKPKWSSIELSIDKVSFGLSANTTAHAGAGVGPYAKIENMN